MIPLTDINPFEEDFDLSDVKYLEDLLMKYGFVLPNSPSVLIEPFWGKRNEGDTRHMPDHLCVKIRYRVGNRNPPYINSVRAGIDLVFPLNACWIISEGGEFPRKYIKDFKDL